MTSSEMHGYGDEEPFNLYDFLVNSLTSLTFGGVVWATGYGLVAALHFGLAYFGLVMPIQPLLATAINIALIGGPILAGLLAAWITYRKVSRME
ncbi:MAG: hypothetical protein DWG76_05800 [Chloroflexi bacterium]|nr:hypothetical protein [Chloroflexota bacterium]